MELLPVGSKVRIQRSAPSVGTWPRYNGREGFIVVVNKETFGDGSVYVEYGIIFTDKAKFNKSWRADVWFKPSEIVPVSNKFHLDWKL